MPYDCQPTPGIPPPTLLNACIGIFPCLHHTPPCHLVPLTQVMPADPVIDDEREAKQILKIRAINAGGVFVHSQGDYPLKSVSPYHSPMVMNITSLTAQPNLYTGQPAIVNTSNSAHSIGSVASNGDMHVDQDAVGKHDMELDNTLPPHQLIVRYTDADADADADYNDNDGQAKDEAMLLPQGLSNCHPLLSIKMAPLLMLSV